MATKEAAPDSTSAPTELYPSPTLITEGRASIPLPPGVFYNPVQEFNRDLTVAAINLVSRIFSRDGIGRKARQVMGSDTETHVEEDTDPKTDTRTESVTDGEIPVIRILDALSATGLRAIRYAQEVQGRVEVTANDIDPRAVEAIRANASLNSVREHVVPVCSDASLLMYNMAKGENRRYHVVDIDPYGSPTQFLDAAVQAVENGGLLCVTCTDMAVLCGKAATTCYAKYGSTSIPNTPHGHETALRIVLSTVSSHANRYSRFIQPLLSVSVDFYVRIFVRIWKGKEPAKRSAEKVGMLYSCSGCKTFYTQPLAKILTEGKSIKYKPATGPSVDRNCSICGWTHHIGGPIWLDPIHDLEFVKELLKSLDDKHHLKTVERVKGILTMITEELPNSPLHYTTSQLCTTVHTSMPKTQKIWSAIVNSGYRVSNAHTEPQSLKTDMPAHMIWDIIKSYANSDEAVTRTPSEQSPGHIIMSTPIKFTPDFTILKGVIPNSKVNHLKRFPELPPNWGPQSRPKKNQRKAQGEEGTLSLNEKQVEKKTKLYQALP